MIQILIVVGALVFLLMGVAHGVLTLRDLQRPRAFTPPDPALRLAMQQSTIRLHPSTNLWKAWMGFNLTHSLGVVLFGAAYLHVGLVDPSAFGSSLLLQSVAVVVSAMYLLVSYHFFFWKPLVGATIGLVAFLLATGLAYL